MLIQTQTYFGMSILHMYQISVRLQKHTKRTHPKLMSDDDDDDDNDDDGDDDDDDDDDDKDNDNAAVAQRG